MPGEYLRALRFKGSDLDSKIAALPILSKLDELA